MGLVCHNLGPSPAQAYQLEFGDLLHDEAARALRSLSSSSSSGGRGGKQDGGAAGGGANGFHAEENQWVKAFAAVRRGVCCCFGRAGGVVGVGRCVVGCLHDL